MGSQGPKNSTHVWRNGTEWRDLEYGQNYYIKGHFLHLVTNFFRGIWWPNWKIFFFMVTLAQMVPSTPKSAKYIDLSFYVGMIHCADVGWPRSTDFVLVGLEDTKNRTRMRYERNCSSGSTVHKCSQAFIHESTNTLNKSIHMHKFYVNVIKTKGTFGK